MKLVSYKGFNALSLDICIGGIVCLLAFSKILDVTLGYPAIILLGTSIWLIYTFDHLVDANRLKDTATTLRHIVHWRYRRTITAVFSGVLIISTYYLFLLPMETVKWGIIIAIVVLIYFALVFKKRDKALWFKEVSSSFIYTVGVFTPILSVMGQADYLNVFLLVFSFWCVVIINLLVFSICERKVDIENSFESIATRIGLSNVSKIICSIVVVFVVLYTISLLREANFAVMNMLFLMLIVLIALLYLNRMNLLKDNIHRYFGDGVFFLPAFFLF
ncbi:MAG: hypothetical protein AAF363_13440 [Bacteroidota bacterium]